MCTGKLPFDGDSAVSIAMKHLKEEPTDAKTLEPSIPEGLNSIIKKAMEKEVSSRYLSASDMYKDLQKVLRDPTTLAVGANGEQLFTTQRVTPISSTSSINSSTINQKRNVGGRMDEKDTIKKKNNKKKYNPIVVALIRLILMIAIFAAAVGIGYYVFEKIMEPEDSETVPGVIGYDQNTAQKLLEAKGFKMEVNGFVDSDLPKEYVAKQRYASGEKLSKGTTVTVSLSSGPKKVNVPDVVGNSVVAAQAKLKMFNLELVIEEEESEEVEKDKIIRQEPAADTETNTGTKVTVYVSKGPHDERVYMPDLSDYNEAQAIQVLKELGLEVEVNYIESKEFPDGKIVSQSFEPEAKVEEGTVIVLVINRLTKEEENPEESKPSEPTPSTAPTATPAPTPTPTPTPEPEVVPDKILKINVKGKGAQKTFKVKVTLNGDIKGRTNIYEGTHNRDEGIIEVPYPGDATGMIRVYIDDKLDSEMLVG
jgi:serine/threonine-protein kinase